MSDGYPMVEGYREDAEGRRVPAGVQVFQKPPLGESRQFPEYRLEFGDFYVIDGQEVWTAERLEQVTDGATQAVPAGEERLSNDGRFILDFRLRQDVGREEAKAIHAAALKWLTDLDIDAAYGYLEADRMRRAGVAVPPSVAQVFALSIPAPEGTKGIWATFGAALDSIPDHARATLSAHWRKASEGKTETFPVGILLRKGPVEHLAAVSPDGNAFTFAPLFPDLADMTARAATLSALSAAYLVARGVAEAFTGEKAQWEAADRFAESWGVTLNELSKMRERSASLAAACAKDGSRPTPRCLPGFDGGTESGRFCGALAIGRDQAGIRRRLGGFRGLVRAEGI